MKTVFHTVALSCVFSLFLSSVSKGGQQEGVIIFTNGDKIPAGISSMSWKRDQNSPQSSATFDCSSSLLKNNVRIPASSISSIAWERPTNATSYVSIIDFENGSRLFCGKLDFDGDQFLANHPLIGELKIPKSEKIKIESNYGGENIYLGTSSLSGWEQTPKKSFSINDNGFFESLKSNARIEREIGDSPSIHLSATFAVPTKYPQHEIKLWHTDSKKSSGSYLLINMTGSQIRLAQYHKGSVFQSSDFKLIKPKQSFRLDLFADRLKNKFLLYIDGQLCSPAEEDGDDDPDENSDQNKKKLEEKDINFGNLISFLLYNKNSTITHLRIKKWNGNFPGHTIGDSSPSSDEHESSFILLSNGDKLYGDIEFSGDNVLVKSRFYQTKIPKGKIVTISLGKNMSTDSDSKENDTELPANSQEKQNAIPPASHRLPVTVSFTDGSEFSCFLNKIDNNLLFFSSDYSADFSVSSDQITKLKVHIPSTDSATDGKQKEIKSVTVSFRHA